MAAVLSMPQAVGPAAGAPTVGTTFSGESTDLLLDALIAASAKRVVRGPSASQMRQLVPFDFTGGEAAMSALDTTKHAACHPAGQASPGSKRSKPAREGSTQRARVVSANPAGAPKPAGAKPGRAGSPGAIAPPKPARSTSPSSTVFAGPGFSTSPAPEALPMPTRALLARAGGSGPPTPTAAAAAANTLKRLLQVPVAA